MPTNRPFFANFLAAFRAHSSTTYKASSSSQSPASSPSGLAATAHVSTTTTTANATAPSSSNPRTITTKATQQTTTSTITSQSAVVNGGPTSISAAALAAHTAASAATAHIHSTPLARSPGISTPLGPHNMSMSPPGGASTPINRGRQRRGSDSSNSSGGFMDALGPEKWYIGGRTAAGEEKFYRLGLVTASPGRRVRSLDRLSL